MIPDWQTNSVYFSKLLPKRHHALWKKLTKVLRDHRIPFGLLDRTRDIWARDYCPIQVKSRRFVKFRYCPDYLRGRYAKTITREAPWEKQGLGEFENPEITLDGGNVVGGKSKAILTDKAFRENPKITPARLRSKLQELLGVDQCIMIPQEPDDPIGHSDGVVRFLDDNLVVVNDYTKIDPAYGKRVCASLAKNGLEVERLPHFREDRSKDGIFSAFGNYVNFLRVGKLIIVPAYGSPNDEEACRVLESLCPKATVVPLNCVKLSREGGVLNCIAWTLRSNFKAEEGSRKVDISSRAEDDPGIRKASRRDGHAGKTSKSCQRGRKVD